MGDATKIGDQLRPFARYKAIYRDSNIGILGDGYDQMEKLKASGWTPIPAWGKDGWDLGDWPYVVFYIKPGMDKGKMIAIDVMQVVEGDVHVHSFPLGEVRKAIEFISLNARWYWTVQDAPWVTERSAEDLDRPYGRSFFGVRYDEEVTQ